MNLFHSSMPLCRAMVFSNRAHLSTELTLVSLGRCSTQLGWEPMLGGLSTTAGNLSQSRWRRHKWTWNMTLLMSIHWHRNPHCVQYSFDPKLRSPEFRPKWHSLMWESCCSSVGMDSHGKMCFPCLQPFAHALPLPRIPTLPSSPLLSSFFNIQPQHLPPVIPWPLKGIQMGPLLCPLEPHTSFL